MRYVAIALALFLGGALTAGLLFVTSRTVQSAPPGLSPSSIRRHSAQGDIYIRVQTVTLWQPHSSLIYTTAFTTTFQIHVRNFPLRWGLIMPADAITRAASCEDNETCSILWKRDDEGRLRAVYTGTGRATIYLEYDTCQRARRDPASRVVTVEYPVGPPVPFSLTHVFVFSRSLHPWWEIISATPENYVADDGILRWEFPSTQRLTFTIALTEPLLGADLVVEDFTMSSLRPSVGDPVRYTVTVRNIGPYETGRAVLAELFVRPIRYGPPVVLTDHVGGWAWEEGGQGHGYYYDALFKWYSDSENTGSYWWAGLRPGERLTGTTVLTWPDVCGKEPCGAWAKVDPTYLVWGEGYEWYGYNPEGFECGLDERYLLPTCKEENNNIASAIHYVYLPLVLRDFR